jgi:hypothetical protein
VCVATSTLPFLIVLGSYRKETISSTDGSSSLVPIRQTVSRVHHDYLTSLNYMNRHRTIRRSEYCSKPPFLLDHLFDFPLTRPVISARKWPPRHKWRRECYHASRNDRNRSEHAAEHPHHHERPVQRWPRYYGLCAYANGMWDVAVSTSFHIKVPELIKTCCVSSAFWTNGAPFQT